MPLSESDSEKKQKKDRQFGPQEAPNCKTKAEYLGKGTKKQQVLREMLLQCPIPFVLEFPFSVFPFSG